MARTQSRNFLQKAKKSKKSRSGLSIEQEQEILNLKPQDLAVEAVREDSAIDTLKAQIKTDPQISSLEDKVKEKKKELTEHEAELSKTPAIVELMEKLEQLRTENRTEDHDKVLEQLSEAKEDLKALKKSWGEDIRGRGKKHKFMKKTLKRHMETGLLKSVLD